MRNLRIIHRSILKSPQALELTASTWDITNDAIICAFGPTRQSPSIELKRWQKHSKQYDHIVSWEASCPLPDLDCDKILSLSHFSDPPTTCLILAGGDIVVVREEPQPHQDKIEIVGSVDVGITAAAWSPDEELLVLTTRADTLLYMTRDFDNVIDITFIADDLKAFNHVSVGWGKKETQFKGKKARALRDPTVPETVDAGVLSEHDSKDTNISWRGDGTYLAVNSIESDSRRVIRVYSREGALDSVSEPVDGLVGALSWRPAGNIIAGVQFSVKQAQVVFFERNGLRHGQYPLRLGEDEISNPGTRILLQWNVDSSVLAVCFKDRVQLWTTGNYHYYLKQEIMAVCEEPTVRPISIHWHPEKPLHLLLDSKGKSPFSIVYAPTSTEHSPDGPQELAYISTVASGPTAPPDDYGIVAVIDGSKCP